MYIYIYTIYINTLYIYIYIIYVCFDKQIYVPFCCFKLHKSEPTRRYVYPKAIMIVNCVSKTNAYIDIYIHIQLIAYIYIYVNICINIYIYINATPHQLR